MRYRHRTPVDPVVGELPALLRAEDLEERGIPRGRLRTMVRNGTVERIGRGLFRLREAPAHELETVAAVCKRLPSAVVCLLTALHVHGIGTQVPREVWVAIDRKSRRPRLADLPMRIVRFPEAMLRDGIEFRRVMGVVVPVTNPARTVIDCFRYRRKVGLDVALEALREILRDGKATPAAILRLAATCRIRTVMRPYVEAMAI